MRYQEYKAKMMKIRKVMDFFYRFRFVFLGSAVAIAATITTLDVTKGNITNYSGFKISYTYGEEIKCESDAFMSDTTIQYRKKGTEDWSDEAPRLVGEYEARARSNGSHGYKYSDISSFEIKPYETSISLKKDDVDFGVDKPPVNCELLSGDTLDDYFVDYAEKWKTSTEATIDLDKVKIIDTKGNDVTYCYSISTEPKTINFNPAPLGITFVQDAPHYYTGSAFTSDVWVKTFGELKYDHEIVYEGGISKSEFGVWQNNHVIKIMGGDGHNYIDNYDLDFQDNYIQIDHANPLIIESQTLTKTYDGQPFDTNNFKEDSLILKSGELLPGHALRATSFENEGVIDVKLDSSKKVTYYDNNFEYEIYDVNTGLPIDEQVYETITPVPGKLTINQKPITITSNSSSFWFDNKPHSDTLFVDTVNYNQSDLAAGDEIFIEYSECTSVTEPSSTGPVKNVLSYDIKRGGASGTSVKDNYKVTELWGDLRIDVKDISFVFAPTIAEYDGFYHPFFTAPSYYSTSALRENAGVLDESVNTLWPNWTYDVRLPNTANFLMREYKEGGYTVDGIPFEVHIWDNNGIEVTSYFDGHISFEMLGNPNIVKKPLQITVNQDYSKEYNARSIAQDIVTNPDDPGTCVEYNGLVDGDLPDVKFNNNVANNAIDVGNYLLSLHCGVKNSSGDDISYNYTFNSEFNISAEITRKPITISPLSMPKTYDGMNSFVPDVYYIGYDKPYGEELRLKDNYVESHYRTSGVDVGSYPYTLDPSDFDIYIDNVKKTDNYLIATFGSGYVNVNPRYLYVESAVASSDNHVYYDEKPHGVFSIGTGGEYSSEVKLSGDGLAPDQRIYFGVSHSITEPETSLDLINNTSSTFGTVIYDVNNNDVTSNYTIAYSDFHINIVQNTIQIRPKYVFKNYDGAIFDDQQFASIPYYEDDPTNSYLEYNSPQMKQLFDVSMDSFAPGVDPLQPGHRLLLTKYTKECATNAIEYGSHLFQYKYKVVDSYGNDVTNQYNIDAVQNWSYLYVYRAELYIYCNSGSKQYDGQNITPPSFEQFDVGNNIDDIVYIYDDQSSYGPKFLENYSIKAQFFNNMGYDLSSTFFALDTAYTFQVSIQILDKYGNPVSIPSIYMAVNKDYYDYTVSKSIITDLKIKQTRADGREIRSYSGNLAPGDVLCFGDMADHEEIQRNKLAHYTHDINEVIIIRNGTIDVTSCYTIN